MKTREQVKEEFERRGQPVRQWARQNGFSDRIVYEVLRGRIKGKRGEAHRVAVLLGLKDGVIE